uniref:Uncharacterized protein n=1 Tax=Plectus sambesii TaxID=2011161 RepID=A0A914WB35_9BILA
MLIITIARGTRVSVSSTHNPTVVSATMANLKQELNPGDYFGVFAVCVVFFSIILIISFTVLNFFCVRKQDDLTVFDKWGARNHFHHLGPHGDKGVIVENETD